MVVRDDDDGIERGALKSRGSDAGLRVVGAIDVMGSRSTPLMYQMPTPCHKRVAAGLNDRHRTVANDGVIGVLRRVVGELTSVALTRAHRDDLLCIETVFIVQEARVQL
jgi:hypothetical protein